LSNLLRDEFLTWVASRPRTYAQTMEAWRSNCPRHAVWEDALADGLVEVIENDGSIVEATVRLTAAGDALLAQTV
jgi:hypothetical protein